MKKSQILAALALAFSLGVVAPVAGLVNNASAITITEGGVVTANRQDVIDTVKAIEAQSEYQQYKALIDAIAESATDTVAEGVTIADAIAALVTDIQGFGANATKDYDFTSYAAPTKGTGAEKLQTVINDAKSAIATVSEKSYDLWSSLYDAMNLNDETVSNREKATAIIAAAEALDMKVNDYDPETNNLSAVMAAVNGTSYGTKYSTIIATINSDQKAVNAINTKIADLKTALTPFVDARDLDAAAKLNTITALINAGKTTTASARYKNYAKLATNVSKVNNDLKDATKFAGNTIATVDSLKGDYKAASGSDLVVSGSTVTDPTNPGATVRTLTSQNGDITVTGAFEEGVTVMAGPVTTNVFGDKAYEAYDITLWKDGKQYKDFKGTAFVTIKLSKVDAAKSTVYFIDGNEKTALETTRGEKTVSFYTTHFSVYAAVEDGATDEDPSAPGTGLVSTAEGNAATTVSIVAGLATALTALGAGVVAYRSARRSNK